MTRKPNEPHSRGAKAHPEKPPAPRPRRRTGDLPPEEHALWVHVTRSAKPMKGRLPLVMPEPAPSLEPEAPRAPAPAKSLPAAPRQRTLPALAGIEKRTLRDLTRGARGIDARIDLHGMRQAEAHAALLGFLHRAQANGAKVALVITGKGAPEGVGDARGVLRRLVPHWLAEPGLRRIVIGFESAARAHGGEGAFYVRIRRIREAG